MESPHSNEENVMGIWHPGPPADAIQLAVSQQKLFLVWICKSESDEAESNGDSENSDTSSWNSLWTDESIKSLLHQHAISLTLEQSTTDATMFLKLISQPTDATGAWIVFTGRVLVQFPTPPSPQDMHQSLQSTITQIETLKQQLAQMHAHPAPSPTTSTTLPAPPTTVSTPSSSSHTDTIQSQLQARRAAQEARKAQHDRSQKESLRQAAQRQLSSTDPERQKYISAQAKERAQKREEKKKILEEIENDKAERRARAERLHRSMGQSEQMMETKGSRSGNAEGSAAGAESGMTKVAVRQPNSVMLKGEFQGTQTLGDVRKWIDENRKDGVNTPYVLQTTFPTRTYEVSEEQSETLSAILGKGGQIIMKEIKNYSDAYDTPGSGVYNVASSLLGSVTGTLGNVLGWNTPPTEVESSTPAPMAEGRPSDAVREARIRNMNYSARERGVVRDDDREKNWFNGNGLAQEAPPSKDEGKKD